MFMLSSSNRNAESFVLLNLFCIHVITVFTNNVFELCLSTYPHCGPSLAQVHDVDTLLLYL